MLRARVHANATVCFLLAFAMMPVNVAAVFAGELGSSGAWKYGTKELTIGLGAGKVYTIQDACTAWTGKDRAYFGVSISPGGLTYIQFSSTGWNWREQYQNATLKKGGGWTFVLQDSLYWGNSIGHTTDSRDGGYSAIRFFSSAPGRIELFNNKDKLIARFPAEGFERMLGAAIRCVERQ